MSAGDYALVLSPSHPAIRIAETKTDMVIECPDLKQSISIPLDAVEVFTRVLLDFVESADDEPDDDGDDDEQVIDPGSFDGGYGQGSYFQHAMRKD